MKLKGFAPNYTSNGLHTIKGLALVLLVVHVLFCMHSVFHFDLCWIYSKMDAIFTETQLNIM